MGTINAQCRVLQVTRGAGYPRKRRIVGMRLRRKYVQNMRKYTQAINISRFVSREIEVTSKAQIKFRVAPVRKREKWIGRRKKDGLPLGPVILWTSCTEGEAKVALTVGSGYLSQFVEATRNDGHK